MSYNYRKTGLAARDFGGSYYTPSNSSIKNYGTSTSNSMIRNYESSYPSKYNTSKSYSRPTSEQTSKNSYGISGKYNTNEYNFEYKPIRKSIRDLSNSPSVKYSSMRISESSPYSTYSSRQGSNSYLSDKDSSRYIPSSISSRESFISPSNSYSVINRESVQKETQSKNKEPIQSPKQSSFISKYKRNHDDNVDDSLNESEVKQANESKCDMISKTSRGTCTSSNIYEDSDKECSLISRTRIRKYPKQNVRIEMGSTVLVGSLTHIGKDISTQTSDDIFLPSPRIRQPSYKSGSSKGSISTSSYYNRGLDNKYSRTPRSSWKHHIPEINHSSVQKMEENMHFEDYSKSSSKEKLQSPKSPIHKRTAPVVSIKDSIEKVNEWHIQNQILESQSNSNRSPVPRSPNYHDLHAVTKPFYQKKSTADEIQINEKKEYSESNNKETKDVLHPLKENLYVTKYTDLDLLLEDQFIINKDCKKQNSNVKLNSYNSNLEDSTSLSNESTLLFNSKASKEIFNSMPIELQHIIVKSKSRRIRFKELIDICRNENYMQKFSDESERSFKGYTNASEMLIDLGLNMEKCKICYYNDVDPFSTTSTVSEPTIKPNYLFYKDRLVFNLLKEIYEILSPPHKLENAVLQLCKFKDTQTEYGQFLDFDLTVQEQVDDLDGYIESGNCGVILRTKLSIRVEALIDKINNANGKELRRALFSLKQIFQDDKDLVQEFVARNGLQCLRQIGSKSDQNHQNYILRALGQLMLYVDGMNGVREDPETIEWLYSLLQGKFRLVVKLALKLLVVFIEYAQNQESHALIIISSINRYHEKLGGKPWSLVVKILYDDEANDSELVTYAITFINKVLSFIPDQDTFYDVTDWLEEQEMESITKAILNKSNADVDMIKQFKIYETALRIEDGEKYLNISNEGLRSLPRAKSETKLDGPRKSKRIQVHEIKNESHRTQNIVFEDHRKKNDKNFQKVETNGKKIECENSDVDEVSKVEKFLETEQNSIKHQENEESPFHQTIRSKYVNNEKPLERFKSLGNLYQGKRTKILKTLPMSSSPPSRPQSLLLDQNENAIFLENVLNTIRERITSTNSNDSLKAIKPEIRIHPDSQECSPQIMSPVYDQNYQRTPQTSEEEVFILNDENNKCNNDMPKHSVKAIKNQFSSTIKQSNEVGKQQHTRSGDVSGIISNAKDNLLNQKMKLPTEAKLLEPKKDCTIIHFSSDTLDWDALERECLEEQLVIKDWNFSDLAPINDTVKSKENNVPLLLNGVPLPPPLPPNSFAVPPAPPSPFGVPQAPSIPKPPIPFSKAKTENSKAGVSGFNKQKRTTRLHWKTFGSQVSNGDIGSTIWSKMKKVDFDFERFESLFENKPHDFKKHETGPKKLEVLDVKRSNAINIGMKNLVSIDCMKNAIVNMTSSVINREGVEKLLKTMLPTQEEIDNIKTAQINNKDAQLGQAEKYLLDLHEINLLQERLEVWLFQLDFEQLERDILESLMDLKLGIKEIYDSETLIYVLSTILKLGNFLNETNVSAFSLEYLQKVPEVKDTKHKHSLLYHVVSLVVIQYPTTTDLHSDLSALNRCHRVDWEELARKLDKLEKDIKKSWDHLKLIFKSDQSSQENIKKLKEFFMEASKRIVKMKIIYRRVIGKYGDVLRYLGFPPKDAKELNVRYFCKILSDFAIEYRTTREKFLQLAAKKEKDKKRKETRGAMIANINSLDRHPKELSGENNDLLNVIMSRTNLANSDCDSDFNSLNNRRARRLSNQPPTDKSSNRTFPRPSSSHQMHNPNSSPGISNMTPATSELALDQSDKLLDHLAQQATSSNKRRTTRRLAGTRERKSMRRTKPNITEDIIKFLDQQKISCISVKICDNENTLV